MSKPIQCDRCTAQATHVAVLESGMELSFCNHHTNKYGHGFPVVLKIAEKTEEELKAEYHAL